MAILQAKQKPFTSAPRPTRVETLNRKKKVLLVDDVELYLEMESSFMKREEVLEIFKARSGEEALELIRTEMPDIVFMDMFMPGMNGDECCRIVKSSPGLRHIPIIIVTHGARDEDLESCMEAGCNEIITKPVNRPLFNVMAKKYLAMTARSEPRYEARLKVRFGTAQENVLTDYSVNLSTGGLFLATDNLLTVDTRMFLEFCLPGQEKTVQCEARVAWTNDPQHSNKPDLPSGMGMQFTKITVADMDVIRDYIKSNTLKADWT